MVKKVGFLHTSASHIATFDSLLGERAPDVVCVHEVREELLRECIDEGASDSVVQGVRDALCRLGSEGCVVVSCTCSTLGAIAESQSNEGLGVLRIDRAVADKLMTYRRVLVVVALESAAIAADELLQQSATQCDSPPSWLIALVPHAWSAFESGEYDRYITIIARFVDQMAAGYDAVFLAQASMLGAARLCHHPRVFTSLGHGVDALIERFRVHL